MPDASYANVSSASGGYYKPILPVTPVAINTDVSGRGMSVPKAWKKQHAAAVSEYAADDTAGGNTGDIDDIGSWSGAVKADLTNPGPFVQTMTDADVSGFR